MLICAGIAFVLSLVITPIVIALCKKYQWYDNVDPRKVHSGAIPRLGGVGIFVSFGIAAFFYVRFFGTHGYRFVLPAFLGGCIIFIFGVIDDFANLRARLKFLVQIVAALIVAASPLYFKRFIGFEIPPLLGRTFTFFWILLLVNAYNLIDGLDLLCGGLSFLTLLTVGVFLCSSGQDIGKVYIILCASILGFLWFNRPPARIFLGDGGSQMLGYAIAVAPLFNKTGIFEDTKILVMILLVSIPVTDVVAAVWRRKREHRSFFSADRAHIHHKLVNIGFSKVTTSLCLLLFQLVICLAAYGTVLMYNLRPEIILLVVSLCFVWLFFITIHYINRAVNLKFHGHLADAPQEEH